MNVLLKLPLTLLHQFEQYYGYDLSNIKLMESSDTAKFSVEAFAQGACIKFAPGRYQPNTYFGQFLIAHEMAHIIQQAIGLVPFTKGGIFLNDRLEKMADFMALHSLCHRSHRKSKERFFPSLPIVPQAKMPIQAWSINPLGSLGVSTGISSLTEGEHEAMTRLSAESASQALMLEGLLPYHTDMIKDLSMGARFNDLCGFNAATFAALYKNKQNPFINQSHRGDMQFLHSMNNGESYEEQVEKQLRWLQFTLNVFQNKDDLLNQRLYAYLVNTKDEILNQMMLSMMLQPSCLSDIDQKSKNQQERLERIKEAVKSDQNCFAYYKNIVIKDFFRLEYCSSSPQTIALASLLHMVEDSFSKAHTQRLIPISMEPCNLSPILLFANYKEQDSDWHHLADLFVKSKNLHDEDFEKNRPQYDKALAEVIENTEGAKQAVKVISDILYTIKKNPEHIQANITQLVKNTLIINEDAMILQYIQAAKLAGDEQRLQRILKSIEHTDLAELNFKKKILPTAGGRQFQAKLFQVIQGIEYNNLLTKMERDNTCFKIAQKLDQYRKQLDLLDEMAQTGRMTPFESEKLCCSCVEIFLHLSYLKSTLKADVDTLLHHALLIINR